MMKVLILVIRKSFESRDYKQESNSTNAEMLYIHKARFKDYGISSDLVFENLMQSRHGH